jgi:uncharacterized coiled-coil DUF342 family protein
MLQRTRIDEMDTERELEDADSNLNKVKKLLDESNEIVDRVMALKVERAQLNPLSGSLRRRMIRCGKKNCRCRKGQLHGPYNYFVPSKCRGKWQYITEEDITEIEQGVADWKKQKKIDAEIKDISARLKEIRREVAGLIPATE